MSSLLEKLPDVFKTFLELDSFHQVSDDLLIEHQVHCMQGEWEKAYSSLELLFKLRTQIMSNEEELLIPQYDTILAEIPKGGAVKYFLREHKLIRKYLDDFMHRVSQQVLNPGISSIKLVSLFEDYHNLKDLFDHHGSRDRVFLFPQLDKLLDKNTQSEILNLFARRQLALLKNLEKN